MTWCTSSKYLNVTVSPSAALLQILISYTYPPNGDSTPPSLSKPLISSPTNAASLPVDWETPSIITAPALSVALNS